MRKNPLQLVCLTVYIIKCKNIIANKIHTHSAYYYIEKFLQREPKWFRFAVKRIHTNTYVFGEMIRAKTFLNTYTFLCWWYSCHGIKALVAISSNICNHYRFVIERKVYQEIWSNLTIRDGPLYTES